MSTHITVVKISHISKYEKVWVGNIVSQEGPKEQNVVRIRLIFFLTITHLPYLLLWCFCPLWLSTTQLACTSWAWPLGLHYSGIQLSLPCFPFRWPQPTMRSGLQRRVILEFFKNIKNIFLTLMGKIMSSESSEGGWVGLKWQIHCNIPSSSYLWTLSSTVTQSRSGTSNSFTLG